MDQVRKPTKLLIHKATPKRGQFHITFQVLDQSDLPVSDAQIRLFDGRQPKGFLDLPLTSSLGVAEWETVFEPSPDPHGSKEHSVWVAVLGSALKEYMPFYC